MSQLGSITAEKEKQMDLERQRFQEVKAKMLAQQKYKRASGRHDAGRKSEPDEPGGGRLLQ